MLSTEADVAKDFKSIHLWKIKVEQYYVRTWRQGISLGPCKELDRLRPVSGMVYIELEMLLLYHLSYD